MSLILEFELVFLIRETPQNGRPPLGGPKLKQAKTGLSGDKLPAFTGGATNRESSSGELLLSLSCSFGGFGACLLLSVGLFKQDLPHADFRRRDFH